MLNYWLPFTGHQVETLRLAGKPVRIGVISNPFSGQNLKNLKRFKEILIHCHHVLHREAQTLEDTTAALREFAHREIGVVAVNGGDGTIQTVLTALFLSDPFMQPPLLALLRGGTDSIIARDAGISGCRDVGMKKLLNWADNPGIAHHIVRRHVMKVDMSCRKDPVYSMIFGSAVVYEGIKFCRHHIHRKGLTGELAPALTVAKMLMDFASGRNKYLHPLPIHIRFDRESLPETNFLLVYVSTVNRLFFGLRPYWGMENAAMHFTAISARPTYITAVLPGLIRGRRGGRQTPENGYRSHNVNHIQMTLRDGFTLDGELYRPADETENLCMTDGGQVSFLKC
jgi:hypothetical protein